MLETMRKQGLPKR